MRVASIILRCEDMETSATFWSEKVGLAVAGQFPGFTFLDAGPIQVILSSADLVSDESLTEVVFEVDDVHEAYATLAARGVPFETELRAVSESEGRELLVGHFRDPDGHYGTISAWVPSAE